MPCSGPSKAPRRVWVLFCGICFANPAASQPAGGSGLPAGGRRTARAQVAAGRRVTSEVLNRGGGSRSRFDFVNGNSAWLPIREGGFLAGDRLASTCFFKTCAP